VRPPTAEADDAAFIEFWEVLNLIKLEEDCPFQDFREAKAFNGRAPEWPIVAEQI